MNRVIASPIRYVALFAAALACAFATASPASASETTASIPTQRGGSGLPLPRFVSLKGDKVNSRVGPGIDYAVEWRYLKSGLPMEIIQEYDNWRRVRDADGAEGWINQSLLSGRRTAIAAPWQRGKETVISLMGEPSDNARVVAQVEPGVIGSIRACNGQWCEMDFSGHRGWIRQSLIWGAYPGETYKD
jgi:SH3-like domain-containing protein